MPSNFAQAAARLVAVTVLPVPPFGENTVTILPCRPGPVVCVPAGRVRRLADREDDVLDELRAASRTSATSASSACSSSPAAARGEQDHRRTRVLADRRQLVRGQRRSPCCVQDGVQVAACQRRGSFGDVGAGADQLDLGVVGERLAELLEPFTGSGGVNHSRAELFLGCGAHYGLLPGPSNYIVSTPGSC